MSEITRQSRVVGAVSGTRLAIGVALRRRDGRAVFATTTLAYLLVYLYAIGHLAPGAPGVSAYVVSDPLGRFLQPALGTFSFAPIARIELGVATYLFSFNTVLGLGIAALVGLNLALTYLAWRQPAACGLGTSSAGVLAGVPALLSGAACCGPLVLVVLGIQATGALMTGFQFLLPAAVALLVGSLLLVGRQVDPARLEHPGT